MVVSSTGLHHEIDFCIQEMERLKVTELKSVSRSIGLSLSGRKADLQDRLRAYLKNSCRVGAIDPWRPKAILLLIEKARQNDPLPTYETVWEELRSGIPQHHPVATGHLPPSSLGVTGQDHQGALTMQSPKTRLALQFSESPFYKLKRLLNGSPKFASKNTGRGVCSYKFSMTLDELAILRKGPQFKLYMFCGVLDPLERRGDAPIQFPHPNDIRLNNETVKDNVRGLKNRLGTAKPADLTPYLKPGSAENHLQLTYAFTKEDHLVYCYLVEVIPPPKILEEVLRHPKIVKPATLQYLKESLSEDEDEDLVTTSTVMTLQCPISYCRMRYPSKSVHCRHLQCFDALWFIESQQQIPTWHCPVCQKALKVEDLAVCEFVEEIIKKCDEDVEQVEISRDGSWKPIFEDETPAPREQNKIQVKSENGQSLNSALEQTSDESEGGQNTGSRDKSQQNDPVVISLDSDDESMGSPDPAVPRAPAPVSHSSSNKDAPQVPSEREKTGDRSKISVERDNTLGNIYGTYMDSHAEPQRSLDPRRVNSTPSTDRNTDTADSPGHDRTPSSSSFINRQHPVPNILGKTPLNNNSGARKEIQTGNGDDTQSDDSRSPSPAGNAQSRHQRSQRELGDLNLPLLNCPPHNANIDTSRLPDSDRSGGSNSHESISLAPYRPSTSVNNTLPPIRLDRRNQRDDNNLLGLGGDSNQIALQQDATKHYTIPQNLPPVDNENSVNGFRRHSTAWQGAGNDNELNAVAKQVSSPAILNTISTQHQVPMPAPVNGHSTGARNPETQLPLPPPLPPIPQSFNRVTTAIKETEIPSTRYRKPMVSPFIPKKTYVNMLPQKRQVSTDSVNKVNGKGPNTQSGQTSNTDESLTPVSPPPPTLANSEANELDFIDLTSDE
ncbi:LANO_0D03114g1_1 [Lachancea nothofagi CBS 11611]|uniref:E3 SUMO-protein transferase SIZ2 n=1 Tax=Lachancea nothofagi CBS 11611 TaxID=1266666 RepID=A0A1G4JEY6_9SACH|nr:LANO_0D03114g1_1 [Lachancea nothofagi CBS 11611]